MGFEWRIATQSTLTRRFIVPQAPLEIALKGLQTVVPQLVGAELGSLSGLIRWSPASVTSSPSLETALWEFMSLSGASNDDILDYAARYGPLAWPIKLDQGGESADPTEFTEPLWAWARLAQAFLALFALLTRQDMPEHPSVVDQLARARAAVAIPLALRAGERDPTTIDDWVVSSAMRGVLEEDALGRADQIVAGLLEVAGVTHLYRSVGDRKLETVVRLEAERVPGDGVWQVRGLLPILAASLVIAVGSEEVALCTRCGKPARIVTRWPQAGRPWYGDHEECRMLARGEAFLRAERKRSKVRKNL